MEQLLGRPLKKGENVHHKDGDRLNNDPSNLELWVKMQPPGQRVIDKVRFAIEVLLQYPEFAAKEGYVLHEIPTHRFTEPPESHSKPQTLHDQELGHYSRES